MNIILAVFSVILMSFCNTNYKKAVWLWVKLSTPLFKLFADIWWIIIIWLLILIIWIQSNIIYDKIFLLSIFWILIINILRTYSNMYVLKNSKMSELFPYDNFDKLIIIILWFFIFSNTSNATSLITVLISILTIIVIITFSIDFKKIKISKYILLHLINRSVNWLTILLTWYILLKYSSLTYLSITLVFELLIYVILVFVLRQSFKTMLKQSSWFYKSRTIWFITWWSWTVIWLYIMEVSWVIIASLLWFMSIIFNIISMKLVLNDSPTKKQILLAVTVMLLIWTWYYFK